MIRHYCYYVSGQHGCHECDKVAGQGGNETVCKTVIEEFDSPSNL